jgi:hypothetical protein
VSKIVVEILAEVGASESASILFLMIPVIYPSPFSADLREGAKDAVPFTFEVWHVIISMGGIDTAAAEKASATTFGALHIAHLPVQHGGRRRGFEVVRRGGGLMVKCTPEKCGVASNHVRATSSNSQLHQAVYPHGSSNVINSPKLAHTTHRPDPFSKTHRPNSKYQATRTFPRILYRKPGKCEGLPWRRRRDVAENTERRRPANWSQRWR